MGFGASYQIVIVIKVQQIVEHSSMLGCSGGYCRDVISCTSNSECGKTNSQDLQLSSSVTSEEQSAIQKGLVFCSEGGGNELNEKSH